MKRASDPGGVTELAAVIDAELRALAARNTPAMRGVRRKYSRVLKPADASIVLRLTRAICDAEADRWFAYELLRNHRAAFARLGEAELEEFGRGLNNWWTVDAFARILAGPAWLRGQVSDELILRWARSEDRWWRRAALVSTVALNMRSRGGTGDVARTLRVCRLLAGDPEDMVAKALSWALREVIVHDAKAVQGFLEDHDRVLAARVKREVKNKLKTGVKKTSRKGDGERRA